MAEELVEFFIVGAPKAGTSSLFHYLRSHPDLVMADPKEPNYFTRIETEKLYTSKEYLNGFKSVCSISEYHSLFKGAGVRGECSVSYLYYPDVPAKIKAYNSSAKIIICLRDPVERAISHHAMDFRLGYTSKKLSEIFGRPDTGSVEFQQYISVGKYAEQVERYLEVFKSENVKIIWFSDIQKHPGVVCRELSEFLGVDYTHEVLPHRNMAKDSDSPLVRRMYRSATLRRFLKSLLSESTSQRVKSILFSKKGSAAQRGGSLSSLIYPFFKADIDDLESLLSVDLSHWRKHDATVEPQ